MLLSNCRYLVTQNDSRDILEDVDVLIEGNHIVRIGVGIVRKQGEETIDCSNRIVMPGLINGHMHLGMTSLRGISDDDQLKGWLDSVVSIEKSLSSEELYLSASAGIKESVRMGTTTLCDMYSAHDMTIKAAQDLNARLVKIQAYFTAFKELDKKEIEESVSIKTGPLVTLALGPHSIYGVSEGTLDVVRKIAKDKNMLIHMHLSETRPERAEFKSKNGCLPVEHLDKIRFLGSDVILIHAVWLTKNELDILAKHKVSIVHCPQSNMKLAGGGVMPLYEMMERGINVCLGTDSAASNNSLDMFREMHVAALLHKHHYWDATKGNAQMVLDMATRNAANAYRFDKLGVIAEGNLADIITLDMDDDNLKPIDRARVVSHIVHSANGLNVSESIIDGKLLLRNKKFC